MLYEDDTRNFFEKIIEDCGSNTRWTEWTVLHPSPLVPRSSPLFACGSIPFQDAVTGGFQGWACFFRCVDACHDLRDGSCNQITDFLPACRIGFCPGEGKAIIGHTVAFPLFPIGLQCRLLESALPYRKVACSEGPPCRDFGSGEVFHECPGRVNLVFVGVEDADIGSVEGCRRVGRVFLGGWARRPSGLYPLP